MLIKYRDRLTADSILALNQFVDTGETRLFQEIMDFVSSHEGREDQLSFPKKVEDALRVRQGGDDGSVRELNIQDLRSIFAKTKIRAISPIAFLRADQNRWEELLKSEACHQLAFAPDPLIYGEAAGFWICFAEGMTGRKYARTTNEVLDFLQKHPDLENLFSDIAMMTNFEKDIKNLDELEAFIDEKPDVYLDFVISRLGMMSGDQRDYILALNADASASYDIILMSDEPKVRINASFAEIRQRLEDSLKAIVAFAERKKIPEQASYFAMGLKVLSGETAPVLAPFWKPPARPVEAGILYCAATNADDFAGMGSWNDVQIEQDEEFRRVSNAVAFSILESVCAAVNA